MKFPRGVSSVGVMGMVPPVPALKKAGLLKMLGDRGMAPAGGNMNFESCVVVTGLEIRWGWSLFGGVELPLLIVSEAGAVTEELLVSTCEEAMDAFAAMMPGYCHIGERIPVEGRRERE